MEVSNRVMYFKRYSFLLRFLVCRGWHLDGKFTSLVRADEVTSASDNETSNNQHRWVLEKKYQWIYQLHDILPLGCPISNNTIIKMELGNWRDYYCENEQLKTGICLVEAIDTDEWLNGCQAVFTESTPKLFSGLTLHNPQFKRGRLSAPNDTT